MTRKTLIYLFDPLCGWCYGASPALDAVLAAPDIEVRPVPTGLFSGRGARDMSDDFAAYAWLNDQRIERLTGQPFTQQYRTQVLNHRPQRFDSGPATLALVAVEQAEPERVLGALKAIQHARYVEGRDITSLQTLAAILAELDLAAVGHRLQSPDAGLAQRAQAVTAEAQTLMQAFGAQGVPAFIVETAGRRQLLQTSSIYGDPLDLRRQIEAA